MKYKTVPAKNIDCTKNTEKISTAVFFVTTGRINVFVATAFTNNPVSPMYKNKSSVKAIPGSKNHRASNASLPAIKGWKKSLFPFVVFK